VSASRFLRATLAASTSFVLLCRRFPSEHVAGGSDVSDAGAALAVDLAQPRGLPLPTKLRKTRRSASKKLATEPTAVETKLAMIGSICHAPVKRKAESRFAVIDTRPFVRLKRASAAIA
jgi:hypothetical protein